MALKGAFDPLNKAQPFLTNPTSGVTKGDQGGSRGLDKKTWFFLERLNVGRNGFYKGSTKVVHVFL